MLIWRPRVETNLPRSAGVFGLDASASGCQMSMTAFLLLPSVSCLLLLEAQLNQALVQKLAGRDVGFLLGVVGGYEVRQGGQAHF